MSAMIQYRKHGPNASRVISVAGGGRRLRAKRCHGEG
jgi:hypothetical protein